MKKYGERERIRWNPVFLEIMMQRQVPVMRFRVNEPIFALNVSLIIATAVLQGYS